MDGNSKLSIKLILNRSIPAQAIIAALSLQRFIGGKIEKNFTSVFPPKYLCSDNAAMIAWAGIERFNINLIDNLEFPSKARWPLDRSAPFLKGPGLKL